VSLAELTDVELVEAFRTGQASPVEALDAVLDRGDPDTAFVLLDPSARAAALASEKRWRAGDPAGPVDGVPTTVKDNLLVRGLPTRSGSLTTPTDPATDDAPGVARLRESGAVLVGKTTMPEFAWKVTTDSPLTGVTRNPWNPAYTPGGSSGGAAAAVAGGRGPLALATDGGGSIRVPAARCGLVGLKPTHGRVADWPASAFGTHSHVGPIARTARDAALMMDVIAKPDPRDWYALPDDGVDHSHALDRGVEGLRIGYSPDLGTGVAVDPEIAAACAKAAAELGAVEIDVPADLAAEGAEAYFVQRCAMQAALLAGLTPAQQELMDPALRAASAEHTFSAVDLQRAEMRRRTFGSRMNLLLAEWDLLVLPVIHTRTERVEDPAPAPALTMLFNASRQPAVSVPVGRTGDGLPIGVQVVAGLYRDALCLRAAEALRGLHPGRPA
jgi:aspartyl-tRNA(Asn)/glutamyl-tRNA(Gln) amidotransferase subunit A